jgi:hypothetical protein
MLNTPRAYAYLFLALLTFLLAPACPSTAQEKPKVPAPVVRVVASPKLQMLPLGRSGTVVIRVTIPQNPQNRVGCLVVDGPMFRSSCWESLPTAPQTQEFRYSGLPGGEYEVMGEVQWVDGEKGERKSTLARDRFVITDGGDASGF